MKPMEVAVAGLWHLGSVTAACLASAGFKVQAYDPNHETIARLLGTCPPVAEPGLEELIRGSIETEKLHFSADPAVIQNAEVLWITFDTPVDEEDCADVDSVIDHVTSLFPYVRPGAMILISSQLPVGSTARLEALYQVAHPQGTARFACIPENLRLGNAIEAFTRAERYVVGIRWPQDRSVIEKLLAPFTRRIEWMTRESAEMTKHGINAFLAMSVAFINELATLCEQVGADAREVERGLKSDPRIGSRAYLKPGAAFAGGTLARDITFLIEQGKAHGLLFRLFEGVQKSNQAHKNWACQRLRELLQPLAGRRIGILGLAYKPGTNTLRRSAALETCSWLGARGVRIQAYDPAINELPPDVAGIAHLCSCAEEAIRAADAVVIFTPWPDFRRLSAENLVDWAARPLVLDANGHLADRLAHDPRVRYFTVGVAA
jgi:UDPglucose 6-dehydrogenase